MAAQWPTDPWLLSAGVWPHEWRHRGGGLFPSVHPLIRIKGLHRPYLWHHYLHVSNRNLAKPTIFVVSSSLCVASHQHSKSKSLQWRHEPPCDLPPLYVSIFISSDARSQTAHCGVPADSLGSLGLPVARACFSPTWGSGITGKPSPTFPGRVRDVLSAIIWTKSWPIQK